MDAAQYINDLASRGRYHFTTKDAIDALGSSPAAARAALRRLNRKGAIAMPQRGFHVIVPPEYRRLGCLPAEQFVPQLMQHLGQPYYTALLSAAERHGAAHQRPQVFQVITQKNRPPILCGKVRVVFVARRNADEVPTVRMNTPRGYLLVSSPEATAFDLAGYPEHCAGLGNVATVLKELGESLDPRRLVKAAHLSPLPWAQRLGYLLDLVEQGNCSGPLAEHVGRTVKEYIPLLSGRDTVGGRRDTRWKLIINATVEPDL